MGIDTGKPELTRSTQQQRNSFLFLPFALIWGLDQKRQLTVAANAIWKIQMQNQNVECGFQNVHFSICA